MHVLRRIGAGRRPAGHRHHVGWREHHRPHVRHLRHLRRRAGEAGRHGHGGALAVEHRHAVGVGRDHGDHGLRHRVGALVRLPCVRLSAGRRRFFGRRGRRAHRARVAAGGPLVVRHVRRRARRRRTKLCANVRGRNGAARCEVRGAVVGERRGGVGRE
eukprot:3473373-Pleurochrysis_carterae.AAC.1